MVALTVSCRSSPGSRTRQCVRHCLAEIGIHNPGLRQRGVAIGEKLEVLFDYPASPGCTSPYAPAWIAEMVRRREGAAA